MARRIDYTPFDIERMSNKEVRKTYSELRKVAYMRQKRLKETFPGSSLAGTGKYWQFPFTKDLTDSQVASALAEVSCYLKNPLTLVKEQKAQRKDLHDQVMKDLGLDLDDKELNDFFNFIDELRARYGAKMVDSKRVAAIFDEMERANISRANIMKEFLYYRENIMDIQDLEVPERKKQYTARDFQKKGVDPEAELQHKAPKKKPRIHGVKIGKKGRK